MSSYHCDGTSKPFKSQSPSHHLWICLKTNIFKKKSNFNKQLSPKLVSKYPNIIVTLGYLDFHAGFTDGADWTPKVEGMCRRSRTPPEQGPLLGVGYRSSSETRTQQPSRTATTWAQNDFLSWRKTSVQDFWRGIVKSEGLTKATICTFIAHLQVDFIFSPQVFFSPPIDSESADRPHRLTSSGRSSWIFWRSEQDRENPMPTIQRWALMILISGVITPLIIAI